MNKFIKNKDIKNIGYIYTIDKFNFFYLLDFIIYFLNK